MKMENTMIPPVSDDLAKLMRQADQERAQFIVSLLSAFALNVTKFAKKIISLRNADSAKTKPAMYQDDHSAARG